MVVHPPLIAIRPPAYCCSWNQSALRSVNFGPTDRINSIFLLAPPMQIAISGAWTTIAEYSNDKYVAILRLRQPALRMTTFFFDPAGDSGFCVFATWADYSFSLLETHRL
jgi:hypothetical protein